MTRSAPCANGWKSMAGVKVESTMTAGPDLMRGCDDRGDIDQADERIGDHLGDHRRDIRAENGGDELAVIAAAVWREVDRRDLHAEIAERTREKRIGAAIAGPHHHNRAGASVSPREWSQAARPPARSRSPAPPAPHGPPPSRARSSRPRDAAGCRRRSDGTRRGLPSPRPPTARSAYARTDARLSGATRSAPSAVPTAESRSRRRSGGVDASGHGQAGLRHRAEERRGAGVRCCAAELVLDAQQPVVLGNALRTRRRAGLDLAGIDGNCKVGDRRVLGLAATVADHARVVVRRGERDRVRASRSPCRSG